MLQYAHMKNTIRSLPLFLKVWVLVAVLSTIFCGMGYILVQQELRSNANDPQIQQAQDAAISVKDASSLPQGITPNPVDIKNSLASFLIIYDNSGKPVAASGQLNNQMPGLPSGVIDYVKAHGQDRFTWQPQPDVRIAAVVIPFKGQQSGFLLAGRSLKEVEVREHNALILAAAAWIASLVIGFLLSWLLFEGEKVKETSQI